MKFSILNVVAALAMMSLSPATGWSHHLAKDSLTHQQIEQLSAHAKTPADHQKLVKQFNMEAAAYDEEAKEFENIAANSKSMPKVVEACTTGADLARKSAAVYRTMAAEHESAAKGI